MPTKNDEVIFDFICCRMLQLREIVIYADKKIYVDEDDYDSYYKVITCTASGTVREYLKFLNTDKKPDKWMLMHTM